MALGDIPVDQTKKSKNIKAPLASQQTQGGAGGDNTASSGALAGANTGTLNTGVSAGGVEQAKARLEQLGIENTSDISQTGPLVRGINTLGALPSTITTGISNMSSALGNSMRPPSPSQAAINLTTGGNQIAATNPPSGMTSTPSIGGQPTFIPSTSFSTDINKVVPANPLNQNTSQTLGNPVVTNNASGGQDLSAFGGKATVSTSGPTSRRINQEHLAQQLGGGNVYSSSQEAKDALARSNANLAAQNNSMDSANLFKRLDETIGNNQSSRIATYRDLLEKQLGNETSRANTMATNTSNQQRLGFDMLKQQQEQEDKQTGQAIDVTKQRQNQSLALQKEWSNPVNMVSELSPGQRLQRAISAGADVKTLQADILGPDIAAKINNAQSNPEKLALLQSVLSPDMLSLYLKHMQQ